MAKLTIVVGLPGSGKSTYIQRHKSAFTGIAIEDFHKGAFNNSPKVVDSKHFNELIANLNSNKDCIIADIAYCDEQKRCELEIEINKKLNNVEFDWIFFENDPEKCNENIQKRNRANYKEELEKVNLYKSIYIIPNDAKKLDIKTSSK